MKLDQKLVDAAIELLNSRFPNQGGLAAAYTSEGDIFTSVVFEPEWGGGGLCAETGAILDAVKYNKQITTIACVSRLSGNSPTVIATPCGICQERLVHWGYDVEIAIPNKSNPSIWQMKTLDEIQLYHWVKAFQS